MTSSHPDRTASGPAGPAADAPTRVRLGVLLDPDAASSTAAPGVPDSPDLAPDLTRDLTTAYPGLTWDVTVLVERLGDPDDDSLDLLEATRDRMLDEDFDLAVGVVAEPLEQGRHTLTAQVSPVHASGVVSLSHAESGAREQVTRVVGKILGADPDEGDPTDAQRASAAHSARQLATDVGNRHGENAVSYGWRVAAGNARLLLRTIRSNRPWMLAASLSKSMSAALATGALTLITTDLWMLSAEYNALQMTMVGAIAVLAVTVSLVVGADLWERPRRAAEREQVTVFNIATLATVLIGVLVLHLALFLAALVGALLLVDAEVFGVVTGEPAQFVQYAKLAWFVGGLATIGSALGAGLEEDDDVREAIFTRGTA